MAVVELVRLIIVLALTAAGYQLSKRSGFNILESWDPGSRQLAFSVVGAGFGYVAGGVFGRTILTAVGAVEQRVERITGAELVTGALGFLIGILAAGIVSWPILNLVPSAGVSYPIVGIVFVTFTYIGFRIIARKRFDVLAMMGLTQPRSFVDSERRKSQGPRVLDTSAIIDGRVVEVAKAGFLSGHVVCPKFVVAELQSIADSSDDLRRARGRRGLEVLEALQGNPRVRLEVTDEQMPGVTDVDAKLVAYTQRVDGVLVTTDFNLHKAAELQGVEVLNVNSLAAALRPELLPGERLSVAVVKEGNQDAQGVGYLDDGTMVVVEGGRPYIGQQIEVTVTSSLQTAAGRMLFTSPAART